MLVMLLDLSDIRKYRNCVVLTFDFYLCCMEQKKIIFEYEGQAIAFEFADGNKMINATQMAKPFKGKTVFNFLRTKQTKDFILLLESRYSHMSIGKNEPKREVLRIIKGGSPELQGTWMEELLAQKFAAWLYPPFEL